MNAKTLIINVINKLSVRVPEVEIFRDLVELMPSTEIIQELMQLVSEAIAQTQHLFALNDLHDIQGKLAVLHATEDKERAEEMLEVDMMLEGI